MKSAKTSDEEKCRLYLYDLGLIVKERAFQCKMNRDALPDGSVDRMFQTGRLLAFNEIITIFQQQAKAFGIDLHELQIAEVDPDKDLV